VGPVYAEAVGFSVAEIVTFLNAGIIGGAIMQYPLGALSDHWDRRQVVLISTLGASASAFAILMLGGGGFQGLFLIFLFGSFAMPIFSLCAAHANDKAQGGAFVQIAAGLMFFYSVGAIVGPMTASFLMQTYGAGALFAYIALVYMVFVFVTLHRILVGDVVPAEGRGRFAALLRTSPVFMKMARRSLDRGDR
jgi:MFS family permease